MNVSRPDVIRGSRRNGGFIRTTVIVMAAAVTGFYLLSFSEGVVDQSVQYQGVNFEPRGAYSSDTERHPGEARGSAESIQGDEGEVEILGRGRGDRALQGNAGAISPPREILLDDTVGPLSAQGIVDWTNTMRAREGRGVLHVSAVLTKAAEIKLEDMFERQYFAHYGPEGDMGAAELARLVEYEFRLIGENLALGNFGSDRALVDAWMESPGHRANLLGEGYRELGVAVGVGDYRGKRTWMAVQVFGTGAEHCPSPDPFLRRSIEEHNATLDEYAREIDARGAELDASSHSHGDEFREAVDAYNDLVRAYNELLEHVEKMTGDYNRQVDIFNGCV